MHDLVIRGGRVVDGTGAAPRTADVAVDGGRITQIGDGLGAGRRELDADGLLVTPGWVDVHTHYDGQALWDPLLETSSSHGVSTVVMGNCGVGFAPVHAADRDWTIKLMEGVEDIPGPVLDEGLGWRWETFPEYLDALDALPHAIDIAAQVPHAAVRVFAMGARGIDHTEVPTDDEIATMARVVVEAIAAGAVGFTTSRSVNHHSVDGTLTPSLSAGEAELLGIAAAMGRAGKGVLELIFEQGDPAPHLEMARRMCEVSGRPLSMTTMQRPGPTGDHRVILAMLEAANAAGLRMRGQVPARPVGLLMSLDGKVHPLRPSATYQQLDHLPVAARCGELGKPEVRDRILAELAALEAQGVPDPLARFPYAFELGDPPQHFQPAERALAARAAAAGTTQAALAYDILAGDGVIYVPVSNFVDGTFAVSHELLTHPDCVPGLGDGGAHHTMIGDFDFPTYLLSFWGRDAPEEWRMPVEQVVARQCAATADLVELHDRGRLLPGLRADVNLVDLDTVGSTTPHVRRDLPSGAGRLVGRGTGYVATIVAGETVYEHGEPTGAMPGGLVRA